MTEQTVIAIVAAVGVVGAAAISAVGVALGIMWRRITHLEADNRAVWWWARAIADMYYRWRRAGAPDLPPPPKHERQET